MPQIILKERTARLASYTFLQEMLIHIKRRHIYSCSIHQEHLLTELLSLATFVQ